MEKMIDWKIKGLTLPSRPVLCGYRFFPRSENGSGPGLVSRFLLRCTLLCTSALAVIASAVVCIFGLIDPGFQVSWRTYPESQRTYQLLPTILIPLASAIR